MSEKSIKLQRTQSLLKELIPEALAMLSDTRLNSLSVIDVDCSKGKYHAKVYIDAPFATMQEKEGILRQLQRAEGIIREHCLHVTGWFKCPNFRFLFDESADKERRLEEFCKQLQKEYKDNAPC